MPKLCKVKQFVPGHADRQCLEPEGHDIKRTNPNGDPRTNMATPHRFQEVCPACKQTVPTK